jgi:hypothetical protein
MPRSTLSLMVQKNYPKSNIKNSTSKIIKNEIYINLTRNFIPFLPFQVGESTQSFESRLSQAAVSLTKRSSGLRSKLFQYSLSNGDVPQGKGVCTDVVIRSYRKLGIDLQNWFMKT